AEAEHPEEHPGADPARRRLAREAAAVARIDGEDGEERDLREDEVPALEALEARRPRELMRREVAVRIEARGVEAARDDAALPEEDRGRDPRARCEREQDE